MAYAGVARRQHATAASTNLERKHRQDAE